LVIVDLFVVLLVKVATNAMLFAACLTFYLPEEWQAGFRLEA
jgi:hypothetical protein